MGYGDDQQTVYNPYNPHYAGQYQPPLAFMQSAMPMYGSGQPPLLTGPFNMPGGFGGGGGGSIGMLMNSMMPMLMSKFAGNGRVPAQFFPQQGYYDQLQAQEFYNSNQQAMQMASAADTAAISRTIGGFQQMMTGKALTEADRARNFGLANTTAQMMPLLTQILGPDLIDTLHGSRGSATVFANQLHTALRTSRDPITGAIGMSGESAGRVSQGVFENLFGADNYNPATLKGMSAGQAGMLAKELQTRGLLGIPLGSRDISARLAAIPADISDATMRRIALNTQEMRDISLNDPAGPTAAQLNAATARVRDTYARLRDPNTAPTTAEDLAAMPGGEDLLRTADASRISNRLKNLSGAVKAMREIFGDMGNPNAPMREIVDGLNRLTQGGLSTMAPSTLEATVRKTQAISKQTGMSVEGIMALTDMAAQMGDRLGLNRGSAVINAQQSAMFGAVAMDTMNLDSNAYGQGTVERVTAADLQLRTAATASVAAQQMNTALRMVEEGVVTPAAGSELEAYIKAAREGDKSYDFRRSYAAFNDMMMASGADVGQVNTYRKNATYNQRYGEKYDTGGTVRAGSMTRDAIKQLYAPGVQQSINSAGGGIDTVARLQAAGVVTNADDIQQLTKRIGDDITGAFFRNMSSETVNDDRLRMAAFEAAARSSIEQNIGTRMPGATPAEVKAAADKYIADKGGITAIAGSAFAAIDAAGASDKQAGSAIMAHNLYSVKSATSLDMRNKQAVIDGIMGSAFAGFGTSSPMQRLFDITQGMGPEGITPDKLGELLGGISKADINAADPTGILTQSLGLWNENKRLDPVKDYAQLKFNAEAMRALWAGGADAKEFYATYSKDPRLTGNADLFKLIDAARSDKYKGVEDLKRAAPSIASNITTADLKAVKDNERRAREAMADPKATVDQIKNAVSSHVDSMGSQAARILADPYELQVLGHGSEALVQSVADDAEKLTAMAAEKKMSVADLIKGDAKAREIYNRSRAAFNDIHKRHGSFKTNEKMTPDEISAMERRISAGTTADMSVEERQKAARESLLAVTPKALRADFEADATKTSFDGLFADSKRSAAVMQAATARKSILQLALDKKLFGNKASIDELTADEIASADDLLMGANLSAAERKDLERLRPQTRLFDKFDTQADKVQALQRAIESEAPAAATPEDGDKKLSVTMTGKFEEINGEGRTFSITGQGDAAARSYISSAIA